MLIAQSNKEKQKEKIEQGQKLSRKLHIKNLHFY